MVFRRVSSAWSDSVVLYVVGVNETNRSFDCYPLLLSFTAVSMIRLSCRTTSNEVNPLKPAVNTSLYSKGSRFRSLGYALFFGIPLVQIL